MFKQKEMSGTQTTTLEKVYILGVFFCPPPPNLTHLKFLNLENFSGGQFKLYKAWDLVKGKHNTAELGANTDENHTCNHLFDELQIKPK